VVHGDGDGWVRCAAGHRHWGRHGAAGLLLRDRAGGPDGGTSGGPDRVVLQLRAWWSHQGNTWGVPGGARDSDEDEVAAALRETGEEAGIVPAAVRPTGLLIDDHGGWAYATVLAEPADPAAPVVPRPTGGESTDVRWVDTDAVTALPLHPGFAQGWPRLRAAPPPLVLVVDAANVVGARGAGDGWWRDRAGATRRLLAALGPLGRLAPAALPPGVDACGLDALLPRVTVVVEGAARAVAAEDPPTSVEVVAAPGSGDDTLVEVATKAAKGATTVVVTADRGLRARLDQVGARAVGPSWLIGLVDG
jgi:8-oxo-dGTP pyrophosphatase MutT (NUDIX family)